MGETNRKHLDRAKELLRAELAKHPDDGVRLLNAMAELPDESAHVQQIAAALRSREDQDNG